MTKLVLRHEQLRAIAAAAEDAFPRECCGLLVGSGQQEIRVSRVVPADNTEDRPDRFLIDPQVQFDLIRALRGTDERLIGHYHSHPNGREGPSDRDAQMALETGQVWLIAPVSDGQCGPIQAYEVGPTPQSFTAIQMLARNG